VSNEVKNEVKRERVYHKNKSLPSNYYNYFDICTMEGIETARAKNAVAEKKVEGVRYIKELKPIEHLFEVFEKPRKGEIRNQYGIRRSHYDYWKRTGKVPKISPGRPKRWEDDTYTNLNIPIKNELYDRFKRMVDNANAVSAVKITYRDMIYVAMEECMQRRPQFVGGGDDDKES
jgi:hypothetical protein